MVTVCRKAGTVRRPHPGIALLCAVLVPLAHTSVTAAPSIARQQGSVIQKATAYGAYWQYIPRALHHTSRVLVIAHGSMGEGESALTLAERFIRRWTDVAEKHRVILIAPAFDRKNYQAAGGYRGLFGREVGADTFVNDMVRRYRSVGCNRDGRIYLYGHSAGGQFAVRYCVRHPKRIIRAVLSAPGRYAFPDASAPWPYGMGPLRRTISYSDPDERRRIDIRPNRRDWTRAAQKPITIVVGSDDVEEQPPRPGHVGRTRKELAHHWARMMNALARRAGKVGRVKVEEVPGVGHNSARLTPSCAKALF